MRTHTIVGIATLAGAIVIAVHAGPLDPPAGPVEPTGKTLVETEPRTAIDVGAGATVTIDEPGSYYLTGDLDIASGEGVVILTGGVTLDLNGFSIRSNRTDNPGALDIGIRIAPTLPFIDGGSVTVRNGRVTGFFEGGVFSSNANLLINVEDIDTQRGVFGGVLIEGNARLRGCTVDGESGGANVQGPGIGVRGTAIIESCSSFSHFGVGFEIRDGVVRDSIARNLSNDAFFLGDDFDQEFVVRLVNCVGRNTTGHGFRSIGRADFEGCVASNNREEGFQVDGASTFVACRAEENGRDGFLTGGDSTFDSCSSRANGGGSFNADGFDVGDNAAFLNCVAADNRAEGFESDVSAAFTNCSANDNQGSGFSTGSGAVIKGCTSHSNSLDGFDLSSASVVTGSNGSFNGGDGFDLASDSRISDSAADQNGSAGIRASFDCSVDGNTVTDNAIGITAVSGALVVRNAAAGNSTNYFIEGVGAAPIVSNVASVTNPLSNIAY
ncbi:MAG: right-handed parallel beta-helix repeat-containing protein [Planctomycetota bacterium]